MKLMEKLSIKVFALLFLGLVLSLDYQAYQAKVETCELLNENKQNCINSARFYHWPGYLTYIITTKD